MANRVRPPGIGSPVIFLVYVHTGNFRNAMGRIIQILLAIFLPPVSVFLQKGIGASFIINVILTIIGILPGSIHALYLLLGGR